MTNTKTLNAHYNFFYITNKGEAVTITEKTTLLIQHQCGSFTSYKAPKGFGFDYTDSIITAQTLDFLELKAKPFCLYSHIQEEVKKLREKEAARSLVNNIPSCCRDKNIGFDKIEYFEVCFKDVSNISCFECLKNVEVLNLRGNKIEDIGVLAKLPKLKTLILWNNLVENIEPLAELENLENLYLCDNKIKDISPLANMKSLRYLHAGSNLIEDISPLAGIVDTLEFAWLKGNPATQGVKIENQSKIHADNYIDWLRDHLKGA